MEEAIIYGRLEYFAPDLVTLFVYKLFRRELCNSVGTVRLIGINELEGFEIDIPDARLFFEKTGGLE